MRRAILSGLCVGGVLAASALVTTACSSKGKGSGGAGTATSNTGTGVTTGTASTGSTSSTGASMDVGDSVLQHHKNATRDGVYVQSSFSKTGVATMNVDTSFNAMLPDPDDAVYAQPLFVDGGTMGKDLVIVATEANNVYALEGENGSTAWKTNLGTPVPLSAMSCGNIDPFGVTGTPVIDFASRTMFLDGLVLVGQKPTHQIFALDIDSGMIKAGWPITVNQVAKSGSTTFTDPQQGERGALILVGSTLYVPFGGLYGDCNPYHGWVVAVDIGDPTKVASWATALKGGGIWSPGGLSSDGTFLYGGTGNTFGADNNTPWGGGNGMIRFGTGAAFSSAAPAFFAPKNWLNLDNGDLDMGTVPVLFTLAGSTPSNLAIMFGKDGNAYLLDPANPGSVSDALSPSSGVRRSTSRPTRSSARRWSTRRRPRRTPSSAATARRANRGVATSRR